MNIEVKRVCHVTCVHGTHDSRIFAKECVSLAQAGYETYLVGPGEDRNEKGVVVVGCGDKPKSRVSRMLLFRKKVLKMALALNCDVYHFHDPELLPYALKLKKRGKHAIFDSHEDVPRQIMDKRWIPRGIRKYVSKMYEKYEKKIAGKLDCVVTATDKITKCFHKYNVNASTIFNYPILEEFDLSESVQRERAICFAGGLSVTNGIKELIDIVDELGVKLYLAGPLSEEIRIYLENKEREKIKYLGVISRNEVYRLYSKCMVGVVVDLPTGNNVEGLPIKMFEYMVCGVPMLTSDFPLRREILEEYPCGKLVDPCNMEEYKNALMSLLDNTKLQECYSINGKKAANEKYNWSCEEKKLLQLYKEIVYEKNISSGSTH